MQQPLAGPAARVANAACWRLHFVMQDLECPPQECSITNSTLRAKVLSFLQRSSCSADGVVTFPEAPPGTNRPRILRQDSAQQQSNSGGKGNSSSSQQGMGKTEGRVQQQQQVGAGGGGVAAGPRMDWRIVLAVAILIAALRLIRF
jgi:hypothetical protein